MTTMSLPSLPTKRVASNGPQPVRWTCDEFHRIGDVGLFEGRQTMLIDGVILDEGPMNPPHALAIEVIDPVIRAVFGAGWRVRGQLPLVLGQSIDPVPDFAILAGTARGNSGHPTTAELVIEAADTSLDFDLNEKRLLYARAGIREYWVVDINGRRLLVWRDPKNGDYPPPAIFGPTDSVTPLAATTPIRVADLLP